MSTDESGPETSGSSGRRWLWRALQLGGTLAGFGYVALTVELGEVWTAMGRIAPWAFAAACGVTLANLALGAVRWRVLLAAYGAPKRPSILRLTHVYWVGFFYNNFVPGGVGGDVVRGIVTRQSFGPRGTTASMTVVLVERALGLSGLLLVVSATYLVRPLPGTEDVLPYSALGLAFAAAGVASVAMGRRLAPHLPGKLGEIAASLPVIERAGPFVGALGLSLGTQGLVAITGWLILASITGGAVSLPDALVLVPLAMAATYFPLSVGGAGAREAAFKTLAPLALGIAEADATAASLLIWGTQATVAALGGLLQLVAPPTAEAAREEAA
ncbi:MAG TPA: lysylphosphatidylglycerol synthase transmembrane domain-containing protein [Sandaracinaceae bacterium LLY-WYZ-13_1]|nr:lysylphosphatidylglycerol synthase transmembrane domain-containing protein [Sandaracinaceae bacterium LLY-WYZ-13_1]